MAILGLELKLVCENLQCSSLKSPEIDRRDIDGLATYKGMEFCQSHATVF